MALRSLHRSAERCLFFVFDLIYGQVLLAVALANKDPWTMIEILKARVSLPDRRF